MSYAAETKVSVERTRGEIERTLKRYGATEFLNGWQQTRAAVGFVVKGRQYRLILPIPDVGEFALTPTGLQRSEGAAEKAHDQELRRRWRALLLVIKAKLEAVQSGITTFENEFGMHTVLTDGTTVAEHVMPAIEETYRTGRVPQLLPPPRGELTARAS